MNSLLQAWMPVLMEDLDNLKKEYLEHLKETVQHLPHSDFPNLQRMASIGIPLVVRIEWCRQQREQARTQAQREELRAEEEGLWDALLERDHTDQYRQSPPAVFERYAMGLDGGRALIRLG